MTTDDLARSMAAQHDIAAEIEEIAYQVEIAVQPRQSDARRWGVWQRAAGDFAEAFGSGQDFDRELSVLGACILEWKVSRLAELAACCCPQMPGVGEVDRVTAPDCPAHGEGS